MPSDSVTKQTDTAMFLGPAARGGPTHPLKWAPVSTATVGDGQPPRYAAEFLQELVKQTQLLACLQWLSEFQILAYIPLAQRVAYADLADLTGLPATKIRRIVQTTATVGFLCEPQVDHVAHTALSVQFVKRPSFLDALMFIAETLVPSALHMAEATRREAYHQQADANPFQIATNSSSSLVAACEKDAKLRRRAAAFQRLKSTRRADALTELLSSIDWEGLGEATVVEVNAPSTATAKVLSSASTALRFVVQMREEVKQPDPKFSRHNNNSSNKLAIQHRVPGAPQDETSAAVYLLHIPDPFFCASSDAHASLCTAELQVHLNLLQANGKGTLILIADVLPECGTPEPPVEAIARSQDLLLLQMGHDEVFDMARLMSLLECVREDANQLTIVNQLSSPQYPILALELCAPSPSTSKI